MKNRERFLNTMKFHLPDDRLPVIEWATWWDLTLDRWHNEGLLQFQEDDSIREYLGKEKPPITGGFSFWRFEQESNPLK